MRLLLILSITLSSAFALANFDIKPLAKEVTAMTRSMDKLFAREEMKESLTLPILKNALVKISASSDVDRKVELLTNEQSLKNCLITHTENKSPDGSSTEAFIEYKGNDCPISITGKIIVVMNQMGADAKITLELSLLSEALKKELDLEKLVMPLNIVVGAAQTQDGGFEMNTNFGMAGKIYSQSLGIVDWSFQSLTSMIFGSAGVKVKSTTDEVYSSGSQKITFSTVVEGDNLSSTEKYSINGVIVSKEIFDQQHESVSMPGMEAKPEVLAQPYNCKIRTYEAAVHSLEAVRTAIRNGSIDSLSTADTMPMMMVAEATGKQQMPTFLGLQLETNTTLDSTRFNFLKKGFNGQPDEDMGRITYVAGEKAELTKQVLTRIVRITCEPN